jgi:hypothetical protein
MSHIPQEHTDTALVNRELIMKLLSDDEVARVSTVEGTPKLADGDEYVDLEHLDLGVRRAHGAAPMGTVLPRKAVHENTWLKIVTQLTAPNGAAPQPRA